MVDVAESLTPATARGAFLMMQIEMERERAALTAKRDSDAQDRADRGATYLRLADARLRSGALIDPPQDNARFYIEAARQTVPDDPALAETSRALQKELLTRAGAAASAGNAAETERWLANADGAGASRQELTSIRRMLQDQLIGARGSKVSSPDTILQRGAGRRPPAAARRRQRQVLPVRAHPDRRGQSGGGERAPGAGQGLPRRAARRAGAR